MNAMERISVMLMHLAHIPEVLGSNLGINMVASVV
jgi:hypothetical protein